MFWVKAYQISVYICAAISALLIFALGGFAIAGVITPSPASIFEVNWASVVLIILCVIVSEFFIWFALTFANSVVFTMENIAAIKDDLYKIEENNSKGGVVS
jgi:hypothetical protein